MREKESEREREEKGEGERDRESDSSRQSSNEGDILVDLRMAFACICEPRQSFPRSLGWSFLVCIYIYGFFIWGPRYRSDYTMHI